MQPEAVKVLVVDDDEDDYVLTRAAFEDIGYPPHRAERAASFDEGERRIMEDRHDIYFIDYRLGEKTGLELLRAVISKGCRKPLVILTGQGDHEVDMEAMRQGAAEYLLKADISAAVLERAVRYAISHFRTLDELRKAKEKAEKATLLKDKFVSLVAHDLKNPLMGLHGFLSLAREEAAKAGFADMEKYLGISFDYVQGMLGLISDLLDAGRFLTGKIKPRIGSVEVGNLARAEVEAFTPAAASKGVELSSAIPQNTVMHADAILLREVVHNVISNAIKFCRKGDRVNIFLPAGKPDTIAVADTGIGIPKGLQENIFKYEEKTTRAGTAGETGTGFGLPLSHDIMKAHGGDLRVESEAGKGSTFYIILPPPSEGAAPAN